MSTKEVNIHIMHSIKGGCGKSSCALAKALRLALAAAKGRKGELLEVAEKAEVLFVDADFRGSALQWIVYGRDDKSVRVSDKKVSELLKKRSMTLGDGMNYRVAVPDGYDSDKNLSQYLMGKCSSFEEILNHTIVYDETGSQEITDGSATMLLLNGAIDWVFAAADLKGKAGFRHTLQRDQYKMPTLSTGIYLNRMGSFLQKAIGYGAKGKGIGQYSHIVIDMPPSYDEYSDLLLMELRKLAQDKKRKIKLHYYSVTTEDTGHMNLTLDNVKELRQIQSSYKEFATINVILNSVVSTDFVNPSTNSDVDKMKKLLDGVGELYLQKYVEEYHDFCKGVAGRWIAFGVDFEKV